jgi:hypothetical protein
MFTNQWMSDVFSCLALQTLRCLTSSADGKLPRATAQESNAAPVADAHEQVQIQGKCFGAREIPAIAAVLIPELDCIRSAAYGLSKFLTVEQHYLADSSGVSSPDDPRARGEINCRLLIGFCSFVRETSSLGLVIELGRTQKFWIYRRLQATASSYLE